MDNDYPKFIVNDTHGGWVQFPPGYRWQKDETGDLVVYPVKQYSIQVYDRPVTLPTGLSEVARFRENQWLSVVCELETGD